MPPKKKKRLQPKKTIKKPRGSSTKKKKVEDKPWKSSLKVDFRGTPEGSRSSTPSCTENGGKSRSKSMTSRDFIRQVLEFDKASESELDSDEDGLTGEDDDRSSDIELKMAIKDSLEINNELSASSDVPELGENSETENDDENSILSKEGARVVKNIFGADGDGESTNDSFMSSTADNTTMTTEQMLSMSVYAPMPEFVPDDMPSLTLPSSSDDLLIAKEHVLRAAGVYEVLRVYSQVVRLSPFIFEEFVAAITDAIPFEYNPLLHEVHSCLVKTLLREEDNNQTSYGPVDLKDSVNSLFFFNDAMTYPHIIREYLRSDRDKEFQIALNYISEPDYPDGPVEKKLNVLEILCNLILSSNSIREELSADGFIKYEDHCRVCQKTGDVLCCDKCSGVYHLFCLDPPLDQLPEGDWACNVCLDSEVPGVTDCINSAERRSMNRNDPLGFDRHWSKYWFLARRIIIESVDGEITYISTSKQLEKLMACLDEKWEQQLLFALNQRKAEIEEHMAITLHLTDERRGKQESYLAKNNKDIEEGKEEQKTDKESTEPEAKKENESSIKATELAAGKSGKQDNRIENKAASLTNTSSKEAVTTIKPEAKSTTPTPITLELSDFVGDKAGKISDLLAKEKSEKNSTAASASADKSAADDSVTPAKPSRQPESVATNSNTVSEPAPCAQDSAPCEVVEEDGSVELIQTEEVPMEEFEILTENEQTEEEVVQMDIASEEVEVPAEVVAERGDPVDEETVKTSEVETSATELLYTEPEALDLQEGLSLDKIVELKPDELADFSSESLTPEISSKNFGSGEGRMTTKEAGDAEHHAVDDGEYSDGLGDSDDDLSGESDLLGDGGVHLGDSSDDDMGEDFDDEIDEFEGEIEEDFEGEVEEDFDDEMDGESDYNYDEGEVRPIAQGLGELGDSDDGQVMDSDEEDLDTSDSSMEDGQVSSQLAADFEEDSDEDLDDETLGYSDQIDGAVDLEKDVTGQLFASPSQIIDVSPSNPGQASDATAIIRTGSGNLVVKLVKVSKANTDCTLGLAIGLPSTHTDSMVTSTPRTNQTSHNGATAPKSNTVSTQRDDFFDVDKRDKVIGLGEAVKMQSIACKGTEPHELENIGKQDPHTIVVDPCQSGDANETANTTGGVADVGSCTSVYLQASMTTSCTTNTSNLATAISQLTGDRNRQPAATKRVKTNSQPVASSPKSMMLITSNSSPRMSTSGTLKERVEAVTSQSNSGKPSAERSQSVSAMSYNALGLSTERTLNCHSQRIIHPRRTRYIQMPRRFIRSHDIVLINKDGSRSTVKVDKVGRWLGGRPKFVTQKKIPQATKNTDFDRRQLDAAKKCATQKPSQSAHQTMESSEMALTAIPSMKGRLYAAQNQEELDLNVAKVLAANRDRSEEDEIVRVVRQASEIPAGFFKLGSHDFGQQLGRGDQETTGGEDQALCEDSDDADMCSQFEVEMIEESDHHEVRHSDQGVGKLEDNDDGQMMDSDEEDLDTSDSSMEDGQVSSHLAAGFEEDSDEDVADETLGYSDQLDGAVDSEKEEKGQLSTAPQQIIISASPSKPGQANDGQTIIKTSAGNQVIKLVNISKANGDCTVGTPIGPPVVRTIQTGTISTSSTPPTNQTIQLVSAMPKCTLVATKNRGIVNLDRHGNVISMAKSVGIQPIASKSTETNKLATINKTYGKKQAVITVPVTATVDQYKSEHNKTTSVPVGQLGGPGTTVVSPQTLLTTVASAKTISLTTANAQSSSNSKPTIKVLSVNPHTGKTVNTITASVGNQLSTATSQTKFPTNVEVIKNSAGVPIKLVRGGAGLIRANNASKPPFTKIVQKIAQPIVSSQGGIMRIISDKSVKTSASDVSSIVNRVVSSNSSISRTPTTTSVAASKYRLISALNAPKGTPQKVLISTSANGEPILKTQEAKIFSLKNPGQATLMKMVKADPVNLPATSGNPLVMKTSLQTKVVNTSVTSSSGTIIRPQPQQIVHQIGNRMVNPTPIRPAQPRTKIVRPQKVVLVDKDGKRSTVTVDARTLKQDPLPISITQKKGSLEKDNIFAIHELDGTKKYVTQKPSSWIPQTVESNERPLRTIPSLKARQEAAQNRQKMEQKIAKILSASKDRLEEDEIVDVVKQPSEVPTGPFKLGMDSGYKNYVNQYTENPHALSRNQQQEERDRKRHLSYKFSLTAASEFKWHGRLYGPPSTLMDTLRATIKQFEEAVPLCFMHPHWPTLRFLWLKALHSCHNTSRFVTVLGLFQCNIKPVLLNSVWNDSLGHLSMFRQTAKDKDDIRRKEKVEKRQQELLEQNPQQQLKSTTVKYTKGLKHQLHKLKGEEFRLSDASGNGWVWIRASRKLKSVELGDVGHRGYLKKKKAEFVLWKESLEAKENSTSPAPVPDNLIDFDSYRSKSCDVVDVSSELTSRSDMYPDLSLPQAKVNSLMRHRVLLEKIIHQKFKSATRKAGQTQSKPDGEAMDTSTSSTSEPMSSRDGGSTLLTSEEKDQCFYKQCYSPLCSSGSQQSSPYASACYSSFCVSKNSTPQACIPPSQSATSQRLPYHVDPVVTRTKEKIDLFPVFEATRKVSGKKPKSERAVLCRPHKYRTRSGKSCPFVLVKEELTSLARKGGRMEVSGFNYASKNAPGFWPYPCPRPRFKLGWEYRLNNCITSIHGVASHLRVLWACVRWDDMNTKPPTGGSNVSTNDSDITTREILEKKDLGPTKLQSQYRVRTIVIPFNFMEQPTRIDSSEPIREGLRKRKKHQMKQPAQPSTSVAWLAEEQLELWEITAFSERTAMNKIEKHDKSKKAKRTDKAKLLNAEITGASALTPLTKPKGPEELGKVKAQLEEQLKLQRLAAETQKLSATEKPKLEVVPTPPGSIITIKGPDGKEVQLKGIGPNQQLLRLPNGKFTIMAKDTLVSLKKTGAVAANSGEEAGAKPAAAVTSSDAISAAPTSSATTTAAGIPTTVKSAADSDVTPLTPSGIQASLLKAQTLSSTPTSAKSLLVKADKDQEVKQETIDVEKCEPTPASDSAASNAAASADDEDTTLTTDVVQQVVARALSSTHAPEIQSRLQEMQRKLATVQGIITVSKQRPKSPERLVSEYHQEMKSKPLKPVVKTMFEPKVPTQEELEMARQKKLRNKEEYKKRKAKDRLKKLTGLLDKHKGLLKKDLKARKDVLDHTLRKEIRDEIFATTGAVIDIERRKSDIVKTEPALRIPLVQVRRTSFEPKAAAPAAGSSKSSTPTTTPTPVRSSRPTTSQYAKKRKISLSSPDNQSTPKPAKMAKTTITKPKSLQNKLYCVCQTPLDKSRFYVGCDICAQWFHGSCVGISEHDRTVDSFTCENCRQHQQKCSEELYCLCNKPYNDAQFYVGCDQCEGWFHPSCVGITQEEAEATDTYVCPTCTSKGSLPSMYEIPTRGHASSLKRIVRSLQAHEMSWPFLKPVNSASVPDYYQVVSEPMDLSTLSTKLKTDEYKTVGDFVKDATKIFNNARYYNATESPIFLCAEKLEKFFVQQLKDSNFTAKKS